MPRLDWFDRIAAAAVLIGVSGAAFALITERRYDLGKEKYTPPAIVVGYSPLGEPSPYALEKKYWPPELQEE